MKHRRIRKKNNNRMFLLLILLGITVGYALISTTLNINGLAHLKSNTWNVYWDSNSINVTRGSVSAPSITLSDNNTKVNFSANLKVPGDYYEFTIDAVNNGTVDAMIDDIRTTIKNGNNQTITLPDYIKFEVTYEDGDTPIRFHKLAKREDENTPTRETYLIRLEFDSNTDVLPGSDIELNISYEIDYVQGDNRAIDRNYVSLDGITFNNVMLNLAYNANKSSIGELDFEDEWYTLGGYADDVANYIKHVSKATTAQYDAVKNTLSSDELIDLSKNADEKNMIVIATSEAVELNNRANINAYMWYDKPTQTIYYYSPNKIVLPKDVSGMFWGLKEATSIDVSGFDTSKVKNMASMFRWIPEVTSLDLSGFDTSKVTDMNCMFYGAGGLHTIDLSNFNTSNVKDMSGMFWEAALTSIIGINDFDVSKVEAFSNMFTYNKFTSLDLSNWHTDSAIYMSSMFDSNYDLASLDISNFNTENVIDMSFMFEYCHSLTSLDLRHFDTHNVTDLGAMFENCENLESIDMTGWDTHNVTDMGSMFFECDALTTLDLSSFDTRNVTNMGNMFEYDYLLTTIYVGDNWNTNKVTYWYAMFEGCTSLVGGNGTTYNSSRVDKTYARIDVAGAPGYLTRKTT